MTVVERFRRWLRKPVGDIEIAAAHSLNIIRDDLMARRRLLNITRDEMLNESGLSGQELLDFYVDIHRANILSVAILAESLGMRLHVAPINKP